MGPSDKNLKLYEYDMISLFEKTVILTPSHSKTNVEIPICIREDHPALLFRVSYSPKSVDDMDLAKKEIEAALRKYIPEDRREQYGSWENYAPLVSLVTLSLDQNGRYLGCAHRHAPVQKHILSAGYSSPGFYRCPHTAGDWRAVINVHAVVSPEVRYELGVFALSEEEAARERL